MNKPTRTTKRSIAPSQQKVVRTFATGHRSAVSCIEFHPFGGFFASGSLDTNVKIWDNRKKNHIQTYKGHSKGIKVIRFSPDGRWLVSGGDDGLVKLWDLNAGKLMVDFSTHSGAITSLDFHPNEFLLATGSEDKTVKFWDLDKFQLVSSTELDSNKIRAIQFTSDGSTLLSATQESLKVWGWEPSVCYDGVEIHWNNVADINANPNFSQLLACSYAQSFVSIWAVTLSKLAPFNGNKSGVRAPFILAEPSPGKDSSAAAFSSNFAAKLPGRADYDDSTAPSQKPQFRPETPQPPSNQNIGGNMSNDNHNNNNNNNNNNNSSSNNNIKIPNRSQTASSENRWLASSAELSAAGRKVSIGTDEDGGNDVAPEEEVQFGQRDRSSSPQQQQQQQQQQSQQQHFQAAGQQQSASAMSSVPISSSSSSSNDRIIPAQRTAPIGLDPKSFLSVSLLLLFASLL